MPIFALSTFQDGAAPATGAPAAAQETPSIFSSMLVPVLLCMVVFYVLIIGPERKQRKKRVTMLASIQKGARVMTTGGMYGTVTQVQDQTATVQVADGVRIRFALSAIQQVVEEPEPEKAT